MSAVLEILKATGKAAGTVAAKFIIWLAGKLEKGGENNGSAGRINVFSKKETVARAWVHCKGGTGFRGCHQACGS